MWVLLKSSFMTLVRLMFAKVFAWNVLKLVKFVKNTLDSLILGILTNHCTEYSFDGEMVSCTGFRCLLTCSDTDTSYAKYGIQTAQQFGTALSDEDESFGPPSIHINHIGHNIKNAEAYFKSGTH